MTMVHPLGDQMALQMVHQRALQTAVQKGYLTELQMAPHWVHLTAQKKDCEKGRCSELH